MSTEDLEQALGVSIEDAQALGEAQESLRAERFQAAGYCCEAGCIAAPDPCPWHREEWKP